MGVAKLPRVGVVIANHNNEAYVSEAIASAARQTVRDIQVVVVDDASTDRSDRVIGETLGQMADPRFRYIRLEENVGQAGAIQRGILELDSEFVCFLDSDDLWYENFIERHLSAHLNADFPVGFTYCDSHFINGRGELLAGTAWWFERPADDLVHRRVDPVAIPQIDTKNGVASFPENPELTLHSEWSPTWSSNSTAAMMFRRSVVNLIMPAASQQVQLYLDFYLSTFCVLLFGGIAIHEALYGYRMHGKNKHSNGEVTGGTFQTSRKDWGGISQDVVQKILAAMVEKKAALCAVVGADHYARGLTRLGKSFSRNQRGSHISPWRRLLVRRGQRG